MPPTSSNRTFWLVTIPLYLGGVWLVSNLAPGLEIVPFFLGVGLLGIGLWRARRGRRGMVYRLYALTLMAVLSVGLFEPALRLLPGLLGGELANHVYCRHTTDPDGYFVRDPQLAYRLRPGYACWTYWNTHWWWHEANAQGYRGPRVDRADAVFLGDSMVYGHGIETAQTIAARFTARTGMPAANLGVQGWCGPQYAAIFEQIGMPLRPKWVFVCSMFNDIPDTHAFYTPEELRRYAATPPAQPVTLQVAPAWRGRTLPQPLSQVAQWWNRHLTWQLRAGRLVRGGVVMLIRPRPAEERRPLGQATTQPEDARARRGEIPPRDFLGQPFTAEDDSSPEPARLGWQANVAALRRIKADCDQIGATMVLYDVGYPAGYSQRIEKLAAELGARYCPAGREVLDQALAGGAMYLPHDAHWTPGACDLLAQRMTEMVIPEGPGNRASPEKDPHPSPSGGLPRKGEGVSPAPPPSAPAAR